MQAVVLGDPVQGYEELERIADAVDAYVESQVCLVLEEKKAPGKKCVTGVFCIPSDGLERYVGALLAVKCFLEHVKKLSTSWK